ncbi:hypothetical protein KSB_66220 [Ktedonobacter robiniae]|uniref:Uncharacterized protein n=1 Tax=Ktedonobacter robiniae TaxID=2778365 RepID=A0ABQ3UZQ7_9CHLR|nr:hypothetical protein KSB_66220 [Ktedonobacter robiniae]
MVIDVENNAYEREDTKTYEKDILSGLLFPPGHLENAGLTESASSQVLLSALVVSR